MFRFRWARAGQGASARGADADSLFAAKFWSASLALKSVPVTVGRTRMPVLIFAILLVLSPVAALAQSSPPVDCGEPAAGRDGWNVAKPEAVEMDPATLCRIGPRFQS